MDKILVLASGGLDSTVLLYKAVNEVGADNVVALSVFYGQKHSKEKQFCDYHCKKLGVPVYEANLADTFDFNRDCCALLEGSALDITEGSYAEQLKDGHKNTAYVPFRNGLFLSYASAVAIQLNCNIIYYGAHKDDAAGSAYPDCTPAFIEAMTKAINEGTGGVVEMQAPWWNLSKADIVRKGLELGMTNDDFENTWSCYVGGLYPCGKCGTCIDRKKAFEANGIFDIY
jgi:7-cyano-7-deazaguanine synthase